jgi:iron complex transport system substrate-binding protein
VLSAADVLAQRPDLVVAVKDTPAEAVQAIEAAGVPVVVLPDGFWLPDVEASAVLLGKATGRLEQAIALNRELEARLERVQARFEAQGRTTRALYYDAQGSTNGMLGRAGTILWASGAKNLAASELKASKGLPLPVERIPDLDPDVLVVGDTDPARPGFFAEFEAHPAIAATRAARDGRIVRLDGRYLRTQSHRLVEAIETISAVLYP